jgi:hypothetical protein
MIPVALLAAACTFWSAAGVPVAPVQAGKAGAKIVEQTESPVLVTGYRAEYQKGTATAMPGVRHDVEYRNRSGQRVVAIQFGLVTFDVWDEFLGRTAALTVQPLGVRSRDRGIWTTPSEAAFAYRTAVVYVERVRFESGEIWTADRETILGALRVIQKDFDEANLAKKEDK